MQEYDIVIMGGGPAGLAAAVAARDKGVGSILILEREGYLGGLLNQCIHSGFGTLSLDEELTGPEFAQRFIDKIHKLKIDYKLNTMALKLTSDKIITAVNKDEGIIKIKSKAVILAMGSREMPKGAVSLPGSRYAGIFTAGTAQRFVNIDGFLPGKEVVILGSGDVSLIMARRFILEGAVVKAVVENMPYLEGSIHSKVEYLDDFDIPLMLSHTIVEVKGKERVEGVVVAELDDNRKPVKNTESFISCDTILLSIGFVPENIIPRKAGIRISRESDGPEVDESFQTSMEGVFACGNLIHVHDMNDDVTIEGFEAGSSAAEYVQDKRFGGSKIQLRAGDGIKYVVPSLISLENVREFLDLKLRVDSEYKDKSISVYFDEVREFDIKKEIFSPGDVDKIRLDKKILNKYTSCKSIILKVE